MNTLDTRCAQLLNASLFAHALPADFALDDIAWLSLPQYAYQQGVAALLFDALPLLPAHSKPPKEALFFLAWQAEQQEQKHQQRAAALADLERLTGCSYQVLKGSFLANLYPSPCRRPSADIDLFCGAETETLARTLERHGIACKRKNPRHTTFSFHDVGFEAHRYLFFSPQDRQRYADWEAGATPMQTFSPRQTPSAGAAPAPLETAQPPHPEPAPTTPPLSAAQQAIFLAAHTCYDTTFFDLPITLRTCLDWTFLCQYLYRRPAELQAFQELLRGATFETFTYVLTKYCATLFDRCQEVYASLVPPAACPALSKVLSDQYAQHTFDRMFRDSRPRCSHTLPRVWRRNIKYMKYNTYYRAIYGQNMFQSFYAHNLAVALRQRIQGLNRPA